MAKNSSADRGAGSIQRYIPAELDHLHAGSEKSKGEKLKEDLKKSEAEGFEKGYSEGLSKGVKDGQKEIIKRISRLDSIIGELDKVKERKLEELLPEIVDLSVDIAAKIIHRKIEKDREIIISVVREAVRKLGREEKMTIRVNPSDYDTMISKLEVLREEARLRDITIEPSESISPGGCYIETPSGEVDARIEEQIKGIRDAISTALDS